MLKNYSDFLEELMDILKDIFEHEKDYIKCKKGCSLCCETGEYPFTKIEYDYLMEGYSKLPQETKFIIDTKIKDLKIKKQNHKGKYFEYECPFLIDKSCSVYEYRGIICRTFGVAYFDKEKDKVHVPGCVEFDLNYSDFYNKETKEYTLEYVPNVNLRTDKLLNSLLAKKYNIECGELKSMIDWFE